MYGTILIKINCFDLKPEILRTREMNKGEITVRNKISNIFKIVIAEQDSKKDKLE